jgi:hypothetical protein
LAAGFFFSGFSGASEGGAGAAASPPDAAELPSAGGFFTARLEAVGRSGFWAMSS